ncbi:hypothetical protein L6R50_13965 [Myxococcota bacterium]|nr:hypothetical protein [Myxococcota bacterium]
MADETRILTQKEGDALRLRLQGGALDEDGCPDPVVHQGSLAHTGIPGAPPIVHLVRLDEHDCGCSVVHGGTVAHVGDAERPVALDMRHSSTHPVALDVSVARVDHGLDVRTGLQEPIHHALQLKTPVQLRFVNPWEAVSDYAISVHVGTWPAVSIRIRGRTRLTPAPAPPDPCLGPAADPDAPRVQFLSNLVGRIED